MKKRIIVVLMIMLLPATAYSQKGGPPPSGQPTPFDRTAAQKKKDAEVEKAYQDSLKANNAYTAPAKIDPWQSVRPANASDAQR